MLEPHIYRVNEQLAKSLIPTWRLAQVHTVDVFERFGFPVRITSIRELGQLIDTMQENRFDRYMSELGGLSPEEYSLFLDACCDIVKFQLAFLPHRPPLLPASTLMSAFAIYKKMLGVNPEFRTALELGPGCGYLPFFLKHHAPLENYSQIEACESFYILQNLVNLHCFGWRCDERALPDADVHAVEHFSGPRADYEPAHDVRLRGLPQRCTHYPWWRIGEIISSDMKFDIVTSNANLLEFSVNALWDYLSLINRCLKPEGIFLVQCTGFPASGSEQELLNRLYDARFAPLMYVRDQDPINFADDETLNLKSVMQARLLTNIRFATNNAIFVRQGHPLFETYYNRENFQLHFMSQEPVVRKTYFERPAARRTYSLPEILEATEFQLLATEGHAAPKLVKTG